MITKQQLLKDGIIWTLDNKWFRKCPSCDSVVMHTSYFNCRRMHLEKHICRKCAGKDTAIRQTGELGRHIQPHTEESKSKMRLANLGKQPWCKGQKLSLKHRQALSISHIGISRPVSEATKLIRRKCAITRLITRGIPPTEDVGAKEWFDKYNKETNSNFQPKMFADIGYIADGYDMQKHTWIEYDTPYHKQPCQQRKDIIRQQNIIQHFQSLNMPLNAFYRVNKTEIGENQMVNVI